MSQIRRKAIERPHGLIFRLDRRVFWSYVMLEMEKNPESMDFHAVCESFFKHKKTSKNVTRATLIQEYDDILLPLKKGQPENQLMDALKKWYLEEGFVLPETFQENQPDETNTGGPETSSKRKHNSEQRKSKKRRHKSDVKLEAEMVLVHPRTRIFPMESYKFVLINYAGKELLMSMVKEVITCKGGCIIQMTELDLPENRDAVVINFGLFNECVEQFLQKYAFDLYCPCLIDTAMNYECFELNDTNRFIDRFLWFKSKGGDVSAHDCKYRTELNGEVGEIKIIERCVKENLQSPTSSCNAADAKASDVFTQTTEIEVNEDKECVEAFMQTNSVIKSVSLFGNEIQILMDGEDKHLEEAMTFLKPTPAARNVWLLLRLAELLKENGNQWTGPEKVEKAIYEGLNSSQKLYFGKPSLILQEIKRYCTPAVMDELKDKFPTLDNDFVLFLKEYLNL